MKNILSASFASFAAFVLVVGVVSTIGAGCGQPAAVGASCDPGVPMDSHDVTIASPVLECQGRICLQVGTAAAACTASCNSDDDCQITAPSGSQTCQRGFACVVAVGVGDYACQRLCVCRDTPAAALSCPA